MFFFHYMRETCLCQVPLYDDNSEVISACLIQSPVLGAIPVKDISGGVKTLILMAFDKSGKIFNAGRMDQK